ncbi:MAG: hypothetical protein KHX03_10350 [Clostridium sp.]|nr:hypothetical protein [Clostridium sp.]
MGLSASQGRLLTLTARKNNLEYQIQQTTQAKMLLANQMDTEATLWSDGMNIQHLYYSKDGCNASRTDDLQRLSYQLVTGSKDDGGLGMQVRDSYGRLVVAELPDPMPDDKTVADYVVEPYCTQADYFETNLKTGNWIIQSENRDGWKDESIEGSTFIYQGVDSADYEEANNEYEEKSAKLQRIDKKFDMRIQQLAAEQQAIETEMDSVKKVIDKNIEETFKTFG